MELGPVARAERRALFKGLGTSNWGSQRTPSGADGRRTRKPTIAFQTAP